MKFKGNVICVVTVVILSICLWKGNFFKDSESTLFQNLFFLILELSITYLIIEKVLEKNEQKKKIPIDQKIQTMLFSCMNDYMNSIKAFFSQDKQFFKELSIRAANGSDLKIYAGKVRKYFANKVDDDAIMKGLNYSNLEIANKNLEKEIFTFLILFGSHLTIEELDYVLSLYQEAVPKGAVSLYKNKEV